MAELTGPADGDSGTQSSGSGTFPATIQQQSGATPSGTTQTASPSNTPKPNKRQSNPLGEYSSVNYQISLYMITPDAYDIFVETGRKTITAVNDVQGSGGAGAYLVAQSGGINNATSARAPGFKYDYYIDNLKINTTVSGQANQSQSNTTLMTFTVAEPYGFSFISNLKQATQVLHQYSKTKNIKESINASKQFFILGLKFLGYDKTGALITSDDNTANSISEKFYDIMINKIDFRIDGRLVTYTIQAAALSPQVAMGMKRGRINTGAKVVASTVKDALTGDGPGIVGLLTKLNNDQQELLDAGSITEKNNYKLRFIGTGSDDIANATIVSKADLDKLKWPMAKIKKVEDVNPNIELTAVPDSLKRQIVFKNDTPILQAIGQIIAQSSYLEDALKVVYTTDLEPDPKTNDNTEIKPNTNKKIKWYNLSSKVSNARWDKQVGDFAFDITYIIQPYETPIVTSAYANKTSPYYGPHKRYEYWYTGKNSEIIKYEQVLNNAFYNVVLGSPDNPTATPSDNSQGGSAQIGSHPNQRQPGVSRLGRLDVGLEAQNSYITSLIDPANFASAKVEILGDPDFLMQESPGNFNEIYNQFYGSDGFTISPNGGQVFIEIDFKEAVDYDNQKGTLDINDKILFFDYPASIKKNLSGISYRVIDVVSTFAGGKFTQVLNCAINTFGADTQSPDTQRETATTPSGTTTSNTGLTPDVAVGSNVDTTQQPLPISNNQQTIPTRSGPVADDDSFASAGAVLTSDGRGSI